ncbi:hypothetical protein [Lacibacter sediminis]|uniref:Uncharacterized protein n=1 Tax=Lacibacter sediminis TaxID=2760713 RepID=A0A7G5XKX8_9BACT|nr:hypothetical protein [Lacibacter sediminis]QNA46131.1 hypothetical protein H4075_08100 [Lacibacter sediminis]
MSKPLCKLCQQREANQTGSHIFSFFLIKDAINNAGSKRRENEISFELSTASFASSYFGSEILPDHIKEVKGRELTEEEIREQENPYTKDNILCSECEKKLSTLETAVADKIFSKLRKIKLDQGLEYQVYEISENLLLRVFVYSLAWRAAITGFGEFRMDFEHQEVLREILNLTLDLSEDALLKKLQDNEDLVTSLPIRIAFFETTGTNDNAIYCHWEKRPYSILINDFCFQLFFKGDLTKFIPDTFFGITGILKKKGFHNMQESKLQIAAISNEKRKTINHSLYKFIAHQILKRAEKDFRTGFVHFLRRDAPRWVVADFIREVTLNNDDILEKYTPEHFKNAALKIILKYLQQQYNRT